MVNLTRKKSGLVQTSFFLDSRFLSLLNTFIWFVIPLRVRVFAGLLWCLKIIKMDVPTHKLVGESVKLVCRFEMEGDTLYSVKWYRNEQEFYR